jgi:hypothetical protein
LLPSLSPLCKDAYILNGIYWSEALNDVFMNNFQKDPTLTWQYFGSSSGFFRIYPGKRPEETGGKSYRRTGSLYWLEWNNRNGIKYMKATFDSVPFIPFQALQ